ncbi:HAMP domain-containing protein [Ramlibacter monticola]|uniref:HAMP domain-containing protein n=2 Tax=Ramlibacter monticola TaxID=1926872 RepID=A0A937CUY1_9BURK|nr:HAMP domain-containing protein [Ramlibacter monticola]
MESGKREDGLAADAAMHGKDRPLAEKMDKMVDAVKAHARSEGVRVRQAAAAWSTGVQAALAGVFLVVFVASAVMSALLIRSVRRPVRQVIVAATRVAEGDLAHTVEVHGRDETGRLLESMARMTDRLRELLLDVAVRARSVADSSAQLAQGNVDLSQRTEEQACTLEETAGQTEELTSTVSQNAENARQVRELAARAAEEATRGGEVVGRVVRTMDGISASSKRIADIIGVIDGIAFQTNILALNAAVEAARAGEQGRGFAVVAAEVRSLAQRSATAAKEIKTLIVESVDQVGAGSKLVDAAGRTMQDIVASVRQVSGLVAEIAAASEEQSAGIEQVNTAISQMDQVVQHNAALVEEAAAVTASMKEQAQALLEAVGRFDLGVQQETLHGSGGMPEATVRRTAGGAGWVDRVPELALPA